MNKKFRLFLDDLRDPSFLYGGKSPTEWWVTARTVDSAKLLISILGYPCEISFDHDLGEDTETGYDFVKWLITKDLDIGWMDNTFVYGVHSMNPVGAENIKSSLEGYKRFKDEHCTS